jgi:hypothetical protein
MLNLVFSKSRLLVVKYRLIIIIVLHTGRFRLTILNIHQNFLDNLYFYTFRFNTKFKSYKGFQNSEIRTILA